MPYYSYQGKKIFYCDEGKGECIVLLPGNTSSSAVHFMDIEFFSKEFRVICPDYIGYGKSDRIDNLQENFWWYNAEMVIELIQSLGVKKIIALGTSGGGIIALNTAIIAPQIVNCVIADSFKGEVMSREWVKQIIQDREMKTEGQQKFWGYAHGEDWEKVIKFDSLMFEKVASTSESLLKGRAEEIICPVLLTGSLCDDMLPYIENGMCDVARKIRSSKVVFYSMGSHPLMWSNTDKFRKEVVDFINNL